MKKLFLLVLSLTLSVTAFSSCNFFSSFLPAESSSSESSREVPKTYTITFRQQGQKDIVKTVEEGEALKDVPQPQPKEGHSVVWSVTDFTNITKDMTVTAVETPNEYTITYNANGGEIVNETQKVTYGSHITLATPTHASTDYSFAGWHLGTADGVAVSDGVWTYAENVTLVAAWTRPVTVYTISFVQGGTTIDTKEVEEGGSLSKADFPPLTQKTGYTVSWDEIDLTNITKNMTVKAVETPNEYTITYDANGGTVTPASQTVIYDSTVTLLTPEREGHTFTGWIYEDNAVVSGAWTIAADVTLVAQWQEVVVDKCFVSFVQNGTTIATKEVAKGGTLTESDLPPLTQKTGYTVSWDNKIDLTNITKNMTVEAVETPNEYTIEYNANGGTVTPASQKVIYDSTVTLPTPEREDYAFTGWTYEGNAVVSGKWTIADDVTLVADWVKVKKYFTVTFVQSGQTDKTYENVEEGSVFTEHYDIPAVVPVTGYNVVWKESDLAKLNGVTAPVVVNAEITPKKYTVTLDYQYGTSTTTEVTYDSDYNFGRPTREGYIFSHWTLNGEEITSDGTWKTDGESFTVQAQWIAKTYTVRLFLSKDDVDSNVWKTVEVTYDQAYAALLPTPPSKDGDKFVRWTYNEKPIAGDVWKIDSTTGIIDLVAKWEEGDWTKNY